MWRKILCVVSILSYFPCYVESICFHGECKQFTNFESKTAWLKEAAREATDSFSKGTLQQIHVIFRHGDRTPDYFYPKDPHRNETFYPVGLKELTNAGKKREYQIGVELRAAYGNLLGKYYTPDTIYARSSSYSRTKMSLQLVLASAYRPESLQEWNRHLDWQPVPSYYIEQAKDFVFFQILCPTFFPEFANILQYPELKPDVAKFSKWYDYLTEHTGMNVTNPFTMFEIYWILRAESEQGLVLPAWTAPLYPEPFNSLAADFYTLFTYNTKLKKVIAGGMVTTLIENILSKIAGENNYRIQLYSGHEINVAGILRALGVFTPHVPQYGSNVVLEVHKMYEEYFIKIVHQANNGQGRRTLKMLNCATLCPLNEFIQILQPLTVDWANPCAI